MSVMPAVPSFDALDQAHNACQERTLEEPEWMSRNIAELLESQAEQLVVGGQMRTARRRLLQAARYRQEVGDRELAAHHLMRASCMQCTIEVRAVIRARAYELLMESKRPAAA